MNSHIDDDEPPQLFENENDQSVLESTVNHESSQEAGPSRPRSNSLHLRQQVGTRDVYDRPKVPITLLTGYLGAGKSTLLEYVLTAQHGYRIAVCMNDFGDTTDIEARSLTLSNPDSEATSTSFLSLPNGCLCCSVKDLGIAAIEDMVASAPGGVDWVMVELTGVADPAPIVRTFWANEEMGDLVLDGVVCVVDTRNVLKQLAEHRPEGEINECQKQVACADVILLNKIDLVSAEQLSHVEDTIRTINPTLRVHHTDHSRAPLGEMFNIRAFTDSAGTALRDTAAHVSKVSSEDQGGCVDPACADDQHAHDHAEGATSHAHHSRVSTVLIPLPPLSPDQYIRLNNFLESLLWEGRYSQPVSPSQLDTAEASAPEILRTKGYIPLEDGSAYVLQGVADIFELKQVGGNSEREGGKIVFIGRDVGDDLARRLKEYLQL